MTQSDDNRLVDYLYGELADEDASAFEQQLDDDPVLAEEVDETGALLDAYRELDAPDPAPFLDAKILASARASVEDRPSPWFRRLFSGPMAGVLAAGTCAVALAMIAVPMNAPDEAPAAFTISASEPEGRPANAEPSPALKVETEKKERFARKPDGVEFEPSADPVAVPAATAPRPVRASRTDTARRKLAARPKPRRAPAKRPATPPATGASDVFADLAGASGDDSSEVRLAVGAGHSGGGLGGGSGKGLGSLGRSGRDSGARGYGSGAGRARLAKKGKKKAATRSPPPARPRMPAPAVKPASAASPSPEPSRAKSAVAVADAPAAPAEQLNEAPARERTRGPVPADGDARTARVRAQIQRRVEQNRQAEDDLLDVDEGSVALNKTDNKPTRVASSKDTADKIDQRWARAVASAAKKSAARAQAQGNYEQARQTLLKARSRVTGTHQEFFLTLALGHLEVDAGRPAVAQQYAAYVHSRASDRTLRSEATTLMARAERARRARSVPPPAAAEPAPIEVR